MADRARVSLGEGDEASHRRSAVGELLAYGAGLAVGTAYGAVAGRRRLPIPVAAVGLAAAAMASTDVDHTAIGVTDPRTWSAKTGTEP